MKPDAPILLPELAQQGGSATSRPTSPPISSSSAAIWKPASRRPTSSSSASSAPRWSIRATSSRTTRWASTTPTATRRLLLDPGAVRRALMSAAAARHAGRQHQGGAGRDRRRLRRQDHGLPGAAGAAAVQEDRASGQDGDDARRSAARHRPDLGLAIKVKMGATKDGKITAAEVWLAYEAGAFPGSPVGAGAMTVIAPYDIANFLIDGYDVVVNRPKTAAYRAPGATNVGVRGRDRDRRAGGEVRDRSDRLPDQERAHKRARRSRSDRPTSGSDLSRSARRSRTASITSPS